MRGAFIPRVSLVIRPFDLWSTALKLTTLAGSALLFCACLADAAAPPPPAAPEIHCELGLGSWCITQGAHEIVRQLADDGRNDRQWTLRGSFRSHSRLIILEPNGCQAGPADAVALARFEQAIKWKGKSWDRATVRVKMDGSCDLTVMFPPEKGDPLGFAFPEGFRLIRACLDAQCNGGDVTGISESIRLRRGSTNKIKANPDRRNTPARH